MLHEDALEDEDLTEVSRELAKRVDDKVECSAPHDRALACDFIHGLGSLGRVVLYGAGTFASELIPLIERLPGASIAGLIDRRWREIGVRDGYRVADPDRVRSLAFDCVLMAHEVAEPEMVAHLLAAGVPRERIVTVFTNPAHARRARQVVSRDVLPTMPVDVEHVILEGAGGGVFQAASLMRRLPPENTVVVRHAPDGDAGPAYRTYDTRRSPGVLVDMLQRLQPRVIYVRSQFTTHFLANLARRAVPDARIIHEVHDFALVTPGDALVALVCRTAHELRTIRLAELDSLIHSHAVLSKYSGPVFNHFTNITDARHVLVYPRVTRQVDAGFVRQAENGSIRAVYAGQLYPPGLPQTLEAEWNYLPVFLQLVRSGRFTVDAFNSMHGTSSNDEDYAALINAAKEHAGFGYHRARGYTDLIKEMQQFNYGLLYNADPRDDNVSRAESIAARMTGYLNAGLPVVLDDGHALMARLIEEFNAGIVWPRRDLGGLVPAMVAANQHAAAMRDGVRRLHAHMTESNRRVLQEVLQ